MAGEGIAWQQWPTKFPGSLPPPAAQAIVPAPPAPAYPFPGRSVVEAISPYPADRDAAVMKWARAGNLEMRWNLIPVRDGLEVLVTTDMVKLGGLRLCASMATAQRLADMFGCLLPTAGIVQAFHRKALDLNDAGGYVLQPVPAPMSQAGGDVASWLAHQDRIAHQLGALGVGPGEQLDPSGSWAIDTTGADYVLGAHVLEHPDRSAAFGWYRTPMLTRDYRGTTYDPALATFAAGFGVPLISGDGGSLDFFDYTRRIMLVARGAKLHGIEIDLANVYLQQPELVSWTGQPERIPAHHPGVAPVAPLPGVAFSPPWNG